MQIGHGRGCVIAALTTLALGLALPIGAQPLGGGAVIWQDRGDPSTLNLAGSFGGEHAEPGVDLRFVKESRSGTAPKLEVVDEHGTTWMVKMGEEAQAETAATRLLWAAGYLVDEDYYRPQIRVSGLPRLARGQQFVSAGGIVSGVRLERHEGSGQKNWSWYHNPFVGTREFNGLRVMMALVNNWDLKDVNNSASGTVEGGRYSVTDLGSTFGRTGNNLVRSKNVSRDYAASPFISRVTATEVDFVLHSRPFFLSIINFPNYRVRTRMEGVTRNIPIADARWIGHQLGRLSASQIADAFRAGGFSPANVAANTQVVRQRIAVLEALDPPLARAPARARADVMAPVVAGLDADRCLASTCRQAPTRETLSAIGIGTTYARAIVGGFEQGAGPGGGVQLTSAGALPHVELRAAALASTRRYRRFDLEAYLPHVAGTQNHVDVWFSYLQRNLDFFGAAPPVPGVDAQFAILRQSYQGSAYRDITDHAQVGLYAQMMHTSSRRGRDGSDGAAVGGRPATPDLPPAQWLPDETSHTQIRSFGGFVTFDTLDTSHGLTDGVAIYGRAASAEGVDPDGSAPAFGWLEGEFDVQVHAPTNHRRTSVLLRSHGEFAAPKSGRSIPFYDLPYLGGRGHLRGYPAYRFRAEDVLLLSTELQQTVYAVSGVRGIDVFASADTGRVWHARPESATVAADGAAVAGPTWYPAGGGGVQYRHSRTIAARVEVSHGRDGTMAYWSLSRGF